MFVLLLPFDEPSCSLDIEDTVDEAGECSSRSPHDDTSCLMPSN